MPPPIPRAKLEVDPQGFEAHALTPQGWPFVWKGRNVGAGCAIRVRGAISVLDGADTVLSTDWQLEPSRVILPETSFQHEMCCLPRSVSGRTVVYSVTLQWDDVPCP